jgi:outer membrane protein OmpA-like peptidoglycan-associated protein
MNGRASFKALPALVAAGTLTFAAGPSLATAVSDANAGLDALQRGDNPTAIRLFSKALASQQLAKADRELAYLKRGEAHLAAHENDLALVDATRALALKPDDSEAWDLRDKAPLADWRQFLIYFPHGHAAMKAADVGPVLDSIREYASSSHAKAILLVGYTDTSYDSGKSVALSRQRAQAIGAALSAKGIKPSIITVAGVGKAQPAVPAADNTPEPLNERVVVLVLP